MSEIELLSWSDLKSKTQNIFQFKSRIDAHPRLLRNYNSYTPKKGILENIRNLILKTNKKINLLIIGAFWCPDSSLQAPRMVKIIKDLDLELLNLQVLYGVTLNYDRKNRDNTWDKKESPPEATNPRFNLTNVPTFYLFKENEFLGRIVERPRNNPTLEEEILDILTQKL